MIRSWLLVVWGILLTLPLCGQSLSIKGQVADVDTMPFPGVKVELQDRNRFFVKGKLTDLTGSFRFDSLRQGKYFLVLTAPDHDTLTRTLHISNRNPDWGLGRMYLLPAGYEINTVSITSEIQAVSLKGDTVEFNAEAFEVKGNHSVEDLLKQLPGVEVENGTVKAHGEVVTRILVDGKEFYGGNVQEAMENLPADAVAKVQVYDKSSEEAEFLGTEDEDKQKAINLKLKKIRKGSLFGEIGGSLGTQNRYRAKGNLNRFVGNTQLAFHGQSFNQDTRPPSQSEVMNQRVSPFALHYFTDMGPKVKYFGVFKYKQLKTRQEETTQIQSDLDSLTFFTEKFKSLTETTQTLWAKNDVKIQLDSMTRLNLWTTLSYLPREGEVDKSRASFIGLTPVNENINLIQSQQGLTQGDAQLNFLKKLPKTGRSLVVKGKVDTRNTTDNRTQASSILLFSDSLPDTTGFRQEQTGITNVLTYGGSLKFNEQLTENWRLTTSAHYEQTRNQITRNFFDTEGTMPIFLDSLSDAYRNQTSQAWAHARIRWKSERMTFFVAGQIKRTELAGTSAASDQEIRKVFWNPIPRVKWTYRSVAAGRVEVDYRPDIRVPRIDELQTVPDNADPLNIYIGNPDLRTEFSHRLSFRYIGIDKKRGIHAHAKLNLTATRNKILNTVAVDENLASVIRPVNVDQYRAAHLHLGLAYPVPQAKMAIDLKGNLALVHSPTFLNEEAFITDRFTPNLKFTLKTHKIKNLQAEAGIQMQYNRVGYDLGLQPERSFLNTALHNEITWEFLDKWEAHGFFEYILYAGGEFDGQPILPFLRVKLARTLFKNDQGRVEVEAYDLFDRNVGIFRTTTLNTLEERQVNYPGRVFLLSFSYRFRIDAE